MPFLWGPVASWAHAYVMRPRRPWALLRRQITRWSGKTDRTSPALASLLNQRPQLMAFPIQAKGTNPCSRCRALGARRRGQPVCCAWTPSFLKRDLLMGWDVDMRMASLLGHGRERDPKRVRAAAGAGWLPYQSDQPIAVLAQLGHREGLGCVVLSKHRRVGGTSTTARISLAASASSPLVGLPCAPNRIVTLRAHQCCISQELVPSCPSVRNQAGAR